MQQTGFECGGLPHFFYDFWDFFGFFGRVRDRGV